MIKDEKEFLAVAMHSYDNPSCVDISEFESDLRKIQYCKKLLRKFNSSDNTFQLLLNNLVVFYNLFGAAGTSLLLYKIREDNLRSILVPFILYLGRETEDVLKMDVNIDDETVRLLREL